jgi:hypothetical protein
MTQAFSRYIVYVDESGDHGPVSPDYPIFVLAFCIFDKDAYAAQVTPAMQRFKFRHFGHDTAVMHEREIRKARPPFGFLMDARRREAFQQDLSDLVRDAPFKLIAAVIDKKKLHAQYSEPDNPYHLALQFGLERIEMFRRSERDQGRLHIVFEARGKNEDEDLELQFHRVCRDNRTDAQLDYEPLFVKKQVNHCGLQLADLIARPIGLHYLRPDQPNRAHDVISTKYRRSPSGEERGWGLKCFP